MGKFLRVTQAFGVMGDPSGYVYTPGQLVDSDARLWDGRKLVDTVGSDKFETVEAHVSARSASVEQATAAPGEKRERTPAKKTAAKKA